MDVARKAPDDWHFCFNVSWTDPIRGQSDSDVVIVVPDTGIFYLEVKGGRISLSGNQWKQESYDRKLNDFAEPKIIDPFRQATTSQASIDNFISATTKITIAKQKPRPNKRTVSYWGFWFIQPKDGDKEYMKQWMLARNAPMVFGSNLVEVFKGFEKLRDPLNQDEVDRIVQRLSPNFRLGPTGFILATSDELENYSSERVIGQSEVTKMLAMTLQQSLVADSLTDLNEQKLIVITGPAGTGKTLIAARVACLMARSGKHVFLTSTSERITDLLAQNVRQYGCPEELEPTVAPYSFLASQIKDWADWKKKREEGTLGQEVEPVVQIFDVMLVDEAEHLTEENIRTLLQPRSKVLILFGDDHQDVKRWTSRFEGFVNLLEVAKRDGVKHLSLTENLRSSNAIWNLASKSTGIAATNFQARGPDPKILLAPKGDHAAAVGIVASEFQRLISHGLSQDQLMLVVGGPLEWKVKDNIIETWMESLANTGLSAYRNPASPGIMIGYPINVRGLEREAAIILIDAIEDLEEQYISLTRAKASLCVITSNPALQNRLSQLVSALK